MRVRLTARGVGLAVAGVAATVAGVVIGAVDLVRIGTLALLLVVAALVGVAVLDPARGRHRLQVHRTVSPNPVHAGQRAEVEVAVFAADTAGRARLAGLRLGEQASAELSGGRPLRAHVSRAPHRVALAYPVVAARRGRWALGPLVVTRTDPFGVARATTSLGEHADVAVWPAVTALPVPREVLAGEPDRVALGARSPSTDDAALRDYRLGDDLRRVHWRSSARRGELMVRSDERAGMRPVSVLLDPPTRAVALEWSVSVAASVALAMLDAGHPVRLVGGPLGQDSPRTARHVQGRASGNARAELLDRTIDLGVAESPAAADADLLAAARLLQTTDAGGEVVLAVLGPLSARSRAALASLTDSAQGWAMVRTADGSATQEREVEHTVRALRRAGWRACPVTPGEDIGECWLRLLGSAR